MSEIAEAFQRIAREQPHRRLVYLPATDTAITAAHLHEAAQAISAAFDAAGLNPRSVICAAVGNRWGYLAAFLACRQRQQTFLPLDGSTRPAEISAVAQQFGASAVLLAAPQPLDGFSHVSPLAGHLTLARADRDPGDSRHGDAALLKMTSGSTGTPRATLTPERALVHDSRVLAAAMGLGADTVQMAAIPLSHAYALGNLVGPLFLQGAPLVLRDGFVPHRLPDDARRYGARAFPGVPFMFDHFVKNPPPDGWPHELDNLISAGAPLERQVAEQFRALFGIKIHPFYGTSETGGIAYDGGDGPAADGMVGTPLPGVEISLMPHEGAPEGGGRVLVRGPAVIAGYADGIDRDSFVAGGYLTGDLATIDAAGQLTLAGRVSSFVNVAGRKVHPDEVERVLRDVDGVIDVRVLGVADARRGEQLVACLVVRGAPPPVVALRQHCGTRLAPYKIPRAFVFLDGIPLTERGKTDRTRLVAAVTAALSGDAGML